MAINPFQLFLTAITAGGKLHEGQATSRAQRMASQIARQNAELYALQGDIARENAQYSLTKGAFEIARVDRESKRAAGNTKAHFAAGNLDPNYGSPLLAQEFSLAQGALDMELIGSRARMEAAQGRVRASSYDAASATSLYKSAAAEQKARDALIAGYFGAGAAILTQAKSWPGLDRPTAEGKPVATRPGFDYLDNPFLVNQPYDL